MDGLSLNDLRQSKSVSTAQYTRITALEHSRRALLKELQNAKISLETVFKTESFNDATGAPHTLHLTLLFSFSSYVFILIYLSVHSCNKNFLNKLLHFLFFLLLIFISVFRILIYFYYLFQFPFLFQELESPRAVYH